MHLPLARLLVPALPGGRAPAALPAMHGCPASSSSRWWCPQPSVPVEHPAARLLTLNSACCVLSPARPQVPPADNYFAALNSAVFSDGSFVFVPKGVSLSLSFLPEPEPAIASMPALSG